MYSNKSSTTKELAEQLNAEDTLRRRWIWVFFGITALLLVVLILLFRGLCTDVWYIKLIGAPSNCGSSTNLPVANSGLSLKDITLSLNGNELSIGGTNKTIILPSVNGLPGVNGTNGINGTNGSAGAVGPQGPAGPNVLTNTLISAGNTITSTVNGLSSGPANIINTIGNTSAGNVLTTSVNGISGAGVSIINSNTLSLTQAGGLSSTVNGVGATQLIPSGSVSTIIGFDGVGNPVNQSLAGLACDPSGNYFCQNGNSFGTQAVFGTTDNNSISTIVNNQQQFVTRNGGMDINPNAATTNPDGNWYTIRIKDMANLFENGIYIYDEGTFQAGSFDLNTGFQANFFTALPGNGIGYPPGAYQASYDGSTVQTYTWAAPNSYVIGNTRFDANPTTFQGAQYIADYSANYVPLSLITLQDLTNALVGLPANNGLTNNSGTIQLGGSLLQNTTITNPSFTLVIDGTGNPGKTLSVLGDLDVTGVIDPTALLFSDGTPSSFDPITNNGYKIGVTGATQRTIYISPLTDSTDIFQIRNSANVAFFDADSTNGRIGIGTATPTQRLDVNGDALINGIRTGLGNNAIATNTAFGFSSLSVNSSGTQNTGIGYLALAANTTATRNTAIGWNALAAVDTGGSNTAVGGNALALATNGSQNTAVGRGALQAITSGGNNNGIGVLAMGQLQTGTNNIAIGNSAMNVANGASQNVVIGVLASITQTTGSTNTIIGYNTGGGLTTGGANTILGANVNGLAAGTSNNVIIADGSGNRRIVVDSAGNLGIANTAPGFRLHVGSAAIASGTTVSRFQNAGGTCDVTPNVAGGITCTSDITLKKNIEEYAGGLETVLALNTISYNMKADLDGTQKQIGFSAQELEKILPGLVQTDSDGYKSVSYAGLTPILTSGLKELNSKFEAAILASDGKLDTTNKILTDAGVRIDSLSDDLKQLTKRVDNLEQQNIEYKKELEEVKINNQELEKRLQRLEQSNTN